MNAVVIWTGPAYIHPYYNCGVGFAAGLSHRDINEPRIQVWISAVSWKYLRGMESSRCNCGRSHCMHAGPSMLMGDYGHFATVGLGVGRRQKMREKKEKRKSSRMSESQIGKGEELQHTHGHTHTMSVIKWF